jgi:hypothetical protein
MWNVKVGNLSIMSIIIFGTEYACAEVRGCWNMQIFLNKIMSDTIFTKQQLQLKQQKMRRYSNTTRRKFVSVEGTCNPNSKYSHNAIRNLTRLNSNKCLRWTYYDPADFSPNLVAVLKSDLYFTDQKMYISYSCSLCTLACMSLLSCSIYNIYYVEELAP